MDRRKKKKKRKLKVKRIIIALILLVAIIFVLIKGVSFTKDKLIVKEYYLSSDTNSIPIYSYDKEQNTMNETKKIPRGTKVKSNQDSININDISYKEVSLKDEKFYVNDINLTEDKDKVVTETKKYVRTSVTVYKNETDSKISSFIKKGNEIDITGYDKLDDDGNVKMYKIKKDDIEGWVYSKYLVDTKELAEQNYNESNTYDTHKDRKYYRELYGGKASTLDYYPYEKVEFDNNPLMKKAKAMYLNAGKNVIADIDSYIKVATSSGVNTIVVDLKDGALAYPMEVAKEYSKKSI